jgi:hypothetical protein
MNCYVRSTTPSSPSKHVPITSPAFLSSSYTDNEQAQSESEGEEELLELDPPWTLHQRTIWEEWKVGSRTLDLRGLLNRCAEDMVTDCALVGVQVAGCVGVDKSCG